MAQPISYSARIRGLEAAKLRIDELPQGTKLSSNPMSDALSVRWPTLRGWCDLEELSGAFVRGDNGIKWEFDPRKTVDALLRHFRGLVASEAERNAPSLKAQGIETPSTSLVEVERLVRLTNTMEDSRLRAGRTTDTALAIDAIDRTAATGRRIFATFMTRLDPTGQLDPDLRSRADKLCEEMQWEWAEAVEKVAEELSAGTNAG
ncbi:MAG: hypothetical protein JNM03_10590 [Sphingopyxis sp.]|uniref:hypothetical protein n=1 Tax=Sphingopyxis sp. TaxID=1908224 RepID=UPI001A544FA7|nr:hypothetical protein [Sphingopyxis sp.]MBL9070425.1 hypothetical protein [Sphingopyxis sp.]